MMINIKATNLFAGFVLLSLACYIYLLPVTVALQDSEFVQNSRSNKFMSAISPLKNIFIGKSIRPKSEEEELSDTAGFTCIGCVIGIRLVEQLSIAEKVPISEVMDKICVRLAKNPTLQQTCEFAVSIFGGLIITYLEQGYTVSIFFFLVRFNIYHFLTKYWLWKIES